MPFSWITWVMNCMWRGHTWSPRWQRYCVVCGYSGYNKNKRTD